MFTGRDRPRSSQDGSAHGTPGRMDGQPRCRLDGITSHEEKKHYYDGKIFLNNFFLLLQVKHKKNIRKGKERKKTLHGTNWKRKKITRNK